MPMLVLCLLISLCVLPAVQGGKRCTHPEGKDGESFTEGCLKMTCKAGAWRSSLDVSLCCYKGQPYLPDTTITTTGDGCATAVISCEQEDDVAAMVLHVENTCGNYPTVEQVQEIKHLLVKYIEQTDCDKDTHVPTSTTSTTTATAPLTEGLLITGGSLYETSVEVFVPATSKLCSLPDLPTPRAFHTMDSFNGKTVICGGDSVSGGNIEIRRSCMIFEKSSGLWRPYTMTSQQREDHTSWVSPEGLLLLGGTHSLTSTEIVPPGSANFTLRQRSRWACAIGFKQSTILTGGQYTDRLVARYNLQGHVEDLPNLQMSRYAHACGTYLKDGKEMIVVAGGNNNQSDNYLSSTEKMAIGDSDWQLFYPSLPRAIKFVASISMGNKIYIAGGKTSSGVFRTEILTFNDETNMWEEVGNIFNPRTYAAITKIDMEEISDICK